jgi:hypothetical protein
MAERAERLGGWIEVGSLADGAARAADTGTVVFLSLPLPAPAAPAVPAASASSPAWTRSS